jgi:uncharacterized membrane protein
MFAVKVFVAATTGGTRDIAHWKDFVAAVAAHGPVDIYSVSFARSYYNHPPLIGYLLEVVHFGAEHGITVQFSIRALASLADVGSALIVFELLRARRPLAQAQWGGLLVGLSPVLFVVSGYHGNTDPVFVFLLLLTVYLLVDRNRPVGSGVAFALAVGVKIVPVVAAPALAVYALRRGPRCLGRFAGAAVVIFLITWLPALIGQGRAVKAHVLEYAGANVPQWGLIQIGHWMGDPGWADWLAGSGRFAIVLVCALLPAVVVWFRPVLIAEAVAFALVAFLFLSPAFGSQYTAWVVAAGYLLNQRWADVYNLGGGMLMIEVYSRWNGSLRWHTIDVWGFDRGEVIAFLVLWAALGAQLIVSGRWLVRAMMDGRSIGHGSIGDRSIGDRSIGDRSIGDRSIGDWFRGGRASGSASRRRATEPG